MADLVGDVAGEGLVDDAADVVGLEDGGIGLCGGETWHGGFLSRKTKIPQFYRVVSSAIPPATAPRPH
ncbi:hypothetical protein D9M69_209870 [compost metagenome]